MAEAKSDQFTKKVIKLADGRELIYYNFTRSADPRTVEKTKPAR